jgi:hypothetical protein
MAPVQDPEVVGLAVAIRAEESEVLKPVVVTVAIDMVQRKRQGDARATQ